MNSAILLRYHEIALKGGNRRRFEQCLAENTRKLLKRSLGEENPIQVIRENGRIVLKTTWSFSTQETLRKVFGITSFSPMNIISTNLEEIKNFVLQDLTRISLTSKLPETFRIFTRRSDKALPETSMQIDAIVGEAVLKNFPNLKVDLKKPKLIIGIEIRARNSYIWTEKISARGGLPVGSNGPVLSLISGGLDSPVAALKALRRGSPTSFIHFYGAPFVGVESLNKVEDLVRVINKYQPSPQPLHVVHFGKIQEKIALSSNPKIRTILYRRLMMRIASQVALKIGAHALVTGESLGQVASQTIQNMAVIDAASSLPILRPLVAFDKDEIVKEAQDWGTFETSIRPSLDCCTLFADRHPVIYAERILIEEEEKKLNIESYIQEGLEKLELRSIF